MKFIATQALGFAALTIAAGASGAAANSGVVGASTAKIGAADRCSIVSVRELIAEVPADASVREVAIDSVKHVGGLGAHCEVIGHTITQNPGPNRVGWSVLLPDHNFGGRYVVQGQGGQGGKVLTADMSNSRRLLATGIVFSSSDTGASTPLGRWAVETDPAKLMDRDYRGAHVSVLATKALTRAFYNMQSPERLYSYHIGCSAGGAMVMAALRNYPKDFDGAVAGTATTGNGNWSPYILQYLLRHPDSWLSSAKLQMLENAVAKTCAGPDGLVRDPDVCGFRPETLLCKGSESDQCLTPSQLALTKRITGPFPVGPGRTRAGFTMISPTGWTSQIGLTAPTMTNVDNPWAPANPPVAYTISQSVFRSTLVNDAHFDFVKDADFASPRFWSRLGGGMSEDVTKDPVWAFWRAGGKFITYSGLSENMSPPFAETEFYEDVKRVDPDVESFMRRYELPGVMHCAGGPGPQDGPDRLLDALIAWVEGGKSPGAIVANGGPESTSRTTLLCPYPQRAKFVGRKGAYAFDAANWACE